MIFKEVTYDIICFFCKYAIPEDGVKVYKFTR